MKSGIRLMRMPCTIWPFFDRCRPEFNEITLPRHSRMCAIVSHRCGVTGKSAREPVASVKRDGRRSARGSMQLRIRERARPRSAARIWAPLARFIEAEARIGAWAAAAPLDARALRVPPLRHQAGLGLPVRRAHAGAADRRRTCSIPRAPGSPATTFCPGGGRHPGAMLAFKLETWEEAKVIVIFHVVGTAMEVFKTSVGSWIYPEVSILRIGGVPLFTGFMYAAIGSYIARAWRLFDFRFTHHPPLWALVLLALAIYVNFFAHHYVRTRACCCSR